MKSPESNPIGYQWLVKRFSLVTVPYWLESRVFERGARRVEVQDGKRTDYYPPARNPGEDVLGHLEFALKREGLHLELLRKLMPLLDAGEVAAWVRATPTGRYARIVWWLYETFTGTRLDLPDLRTGNYVDLLDPDAYITRRGGQVRRQRIHVNLLGTVHFSPMVRKEGLGEWNEKALRERCQQVAADYPSEIFERAVRYLYAKESKSSHEIERETPGQKRAERFIKLLEQAWLRDFLTKGALVELQQAIVDTRFANSGWRSVIAEQVYVGETMAPGQGIILPVSAVILNRPREYDQALESFSKPLMERVEYTLDDRQRMTVTNDTADFYRYIDCTDPTRITIDFVRETIETVLPQELRFLTQHDEIRRRMSDIVGLPDRHADLFVMLCRQNGGTLSKSKRGLPEFTLLTNAEIAAMEAIIREVLVPCSLSDHEVL